jgi:hypothetical protein
MGISQNDPMRVAPIFPKGSVTVTLKPIDFVVDGGILHVTTGDALPTEVVAEALHIRLSLLEPSDRGQWALDVEAFDQIGFAGIGELSDVLTEALAQVETFATKWARRLRDQRDE